MFGRPYGFPVMGERVLISDYRVDSESPRVQKSFRVVKQFKESWLSIVLQSAAPGSVARLFIDQRRAGTVALLPAAEPLGLYGLATFLVVLFAVHFLVPRYFNLTASALYATRNLTLRRH